MKGEKIFTVSQINRYIKGLMDMDAILTGLWIKGEISNNKENSSGHTYFTLKDSKGVMNCVLFKTAGEMLRVSLENGMSVILYGYISVYEKSGRYQFYVEQAEEAGRGSLTIAFELLKKRLLEEGLFDPEYKRELPAYPAKIAVVTSPFGAAVRDIIKTVKARNKTVGITLVPVPVQGDKAAKEIADAIDLVNRRGESDIIIVGRGGGSIEDLWAFNEEAVARAIFRSRIPVISAVGHETDFTISDFVADVRAATPTAAAEIASPALEGMLSGLSGYEKRMELRVSRILERESERLGRLMERPALARPETTLNRMKEKISFLESGMNRISDKKRALEWERLISAEKRLSALSPLSIIRRGYTLTYDSGGKLITSALKIETGDRITVMFKDGSIGAVAGGGNE